MHQVLVIEHQLLENSLGPDVFSQFIILPVSPWMRGGDVLVQVIAESPIILLFLSISVYIDRNLISDYQFCNQRCSTNLLVRIGRFLSLLSLSNWYSLKSTEQNIREKCQGKELFHSIPSGAWVEL